jgi:hypothetical protein
VSAYDIVEFSNEKHGLAKLHTRPFSFIAKYSFSIVQSFEDHYPTGFFSSI